MVFKQGFTLLEATATTPFFAFVSIIFDRMVVHPFEVPLTVMERECLVDLSNLKCISRCKPPTVCSFLAPA